ncbi:hypothetical protein HPB49_015990 [Dermacentor silvarum]|uniref:Uncharacterized protein n=1 Tax=Dermacentor silvarum TaxID=543639 RepID=A0ACB8C4R0_DERSI|nr:hypothetical protein HPB49_015990 [Dermacentor silvarum]
MAPADVFAAVLRDAEASFTVVATRSHYRHPRGPTRETTIPPVTATLPEAFNKTPTRNIAGTALFRPAAAGASFWRPSRLKIAEVLSALPGVVEVRVNKCLDIVAVDADASGRLQNLLTTTEQAGIAVVAPPPLPAPFDRSQCTGFVHGVDRDISDHNLLAAVSSSVPVVSVKRSGDTVTFRFTATIPPECIHLACNVDATVTLLRPVLSQKGACGAAGNTSRAPVSSDDLDAFTAEDRTLQTTRDVRAGRRSAKWRRWLLLPRSSPSTRSLSHGARRLRTRSNAYVWLGLYATVTCGSSALRSETFTRQKLAAGALDLVQPNPASRGARRRRRNRKASIKPSQASVSVAQTSGGPIPEVTAPSAAVNKSPADAAAAMASLRAEVVTLKLLLQTMTALLPEDNPLRVSCFAAGGQANHG